jgi:hypothetical protein
MKSIRECKSSDRLDLDDVRLDARRGVSDLDAFGSAQMSAARIAARGAAFRSAERTCGEKGLNPLFPAL